MQNVTPRPHRASPPAAPGLAAAACATFFLRGRMPAFADPCANRSGLPQLQRSWLPLFALPSFSGAGCSDAGPDAPASRRLSAQDAPMVAGCRCLRYRFFPAPAGRMPAPTPRLAGACLPRLLRWWRAAAACATVFFRRRLAGRRPPTPGQPALVCPGCSDGGGLPLLALPFFFGAGCLQFFFLQLSSYPQKDFQP